jgi:hypothetical protein
MPSETFTQPQFNPPTGNANPNMSSSTPNVSSFAPGQETQSQWTRSVARSKTVKKATSTVITTRAEFRAYLQQSGLDLMTSAIEFQESGDFIQSSYVIYPAQNFYKEPLSAFVDRYPTVKLAAESIRDNLRTVQSQMQVVSKG